MTPKKPTRTPKCVICQKPQQTKYRPFCSARCADVDLHRWLSGGYRIPSEEVAEDTLVDTTEDPAGRDTENLLEQG